MDLDGDGDLKDDGDDVANDLEDDGEDDNEIMTWGCVCKCIQQSSWCPKDQLKYFWGIQTNQQLKNKSS